MTNTTGRMAIPCLVWQADTRSMNPTVPAAAIEQAYEQDESAAGTEYGADFRRDIESFISPEAVAATVMPHGLNSHHSQTSNTEPLSIPAVVPRIRSPWPSLTEKMARLSWIVCESTGRHSAPRL